MNDRHRELVDAACAQRLHSYSPYSRFRVGAALLGRSGKVYLGTNVENASFGLSICAERSAMCRAVSDGEREFEAIAVCADGGTPTPPCGACRQFLLEFGADMIVLLAGRDGSAGEVKQFTTGDLVPHAFVDFQAAVREENGHRASGPADGKDDA